MPFALTWLPQVLRSAGLKVSETQGWAECGRAEMGTIQGVICHHTGTVQPGNMPTLGMLTKGRPDLPGPLCQLGLGRDGTFYIVAAGRANHAGPGQWRNKTGNAHFIGIEGENGGRPQDAWPEVQMDAYRRGVAAILTYCGLSVDMCCGHKEFAPNRKIDPLFDMNEFRTAVAAIMTGAGPIRPLIPAADDKGRPTIRRGARGDDVKKLQAKLKLKSVDGIFGPTTEAAVREFQRKAELVPDGIVGPKTWAKLV